jgi:exodeoxyribonuclease V gamma subunit
LGRYDIHSASGRLPQGAIGRTAYKQITDDIKALGRAVQTYRQGQLLAPLIIDVLFDGITLTGTIDNIYESRRLQYRPAPVKPKDKLSCWVKHLALNLVDNDSYARSGILIGSDTILKFKPLINARSLLMEFIKLFIEGQARPLPFFPESSYAYAGKASGKQPDYKALSVARNTWRSGDYKRGESEDPYYRLCFGNRDPLDDEFVNLAIAIFQPLLEHLKDSR